MSRIVLKSFTSGSSHTSYLSRVTMTGIRSCRSATRAFGPIVKIVQLSMISPSGLWDQWRSPDGEIIESCTILTIGPNALVADLHDRMPVIVTRDKYDVWLDPESRKSVV